MAKISTHVLDVAAGKPAAGIAVQLFFGLTPKGMAVTNEDGRTDAPLFSAETLEPGGYDLIFDVGTYFEAQGTQAFYGIITIRFLVTDTAASYHVPLLLSPHGYSTYRGS